MAELNEVGPNIEKIMSDLRNKLRRQMDSVKTTQEHLGYIEKQQYNLTPTAKK